MTAVDFYLILPADVRREEPGLVERLKQVLPDVLQTCESTYHVTHCDTSSVSATVYVGSWGVDDKTGGVEIRVDIDLPNPTGVVHATLLETITIFADVVITEVWQPTEENPTAPLACWNLACGGDRAGLITGTDGQMVREW